MRLSWQPERPRRSEPVYDLHATSSGASDPAGDLLGFRLRNQSH